MKRVAITFVALVILAFVCGSVFIYVYYVIPKANDAEQSISPSKAMNLESKEAVDEVIEAALDKITVWEIGPATPSERVVICVIGTISGTANGGIGNFLFDPTYEEPTDFLHCADAFNATGASEVAKELRAVLKLFPRGLPQADRDERARTFNELNNLAIDPLEKLEDLIIDEEEEHRKKLAAFIVRSRLLGEAELNEVSLRVRDGELIQAAYRLVQIRIDTGEADLSSQPEGIVFYVTKALESVIFYEDETVDPELYLTYANAFDAIGASEVSQEIKRALSLFPGGRPQPDPSERRRTLDILEEQPAEPLKPLWRAFYDDKAHRRLLARYILNSGMLGHPPDITLSAGPVFDLIVKRDYVALAAVLTDDVKASNRLGFPDVEQPHMAMHPLEFAIFRGDHRSASLLLKHGADPNKRTAYQNTAMHEAAGRGDVAMIDLLAKYGGDINAGNRLKITPLSFAVGTGNLDATKRLLDLRADVGAIVHKDNRRILHRVESVDVAKLLRAAGAELEPSDDNGRTPLHSAIYNGFIDVAVFLIQEGANTTIQDRKGLTPIDLARQRLEGDDLRKILAAAEDRSK
ncbi:MAG: ankyrin repeat domain-containing protein [Verrucomicrobiae bacterium]|nr:ankyrin repeat domain-containing protein [Verrucomicrobiae bacterium]